MEAPPRTGRRMRCPGHLERTGRPPAREASEPGQRLTHRRRPHGRGGCSGRSVGCRHPRDHEGIRRRATESRLAVPVEENGSLSTVLRRRRGCAARIGQRWRHLSPGTARRIAEASLQRMCPSARAQRSWSSTGAGNVERRGVSRMKPAQPRAGRESPFQGHTIRWSTPCLPRAHRVQLCP